jgi:hypothetical protein
MRPADSGGVAGNVDVCRTACTPAIDARFPASERLVPLVIAPEGAGKGDIGHETLVQEQLVREQGRLGAIRSVTHRCQPIVAKRGDCRRAAKKRNAFVDFLQDRRLLLVVRGAANRHCMRQGTEQARALQSVDDARELDTGSAAAATRRGK